MRASLSLAVAAAASVACLSQSVHAQAKASRSDDNKTACTRHYTVKQGDTCDIIGQKTMTSTYQIMALNLHMSGPHCYKLEPGFDLCLGTYGSDCQLVHRVHSQDTCESIAQQYGISVKRLHENNPSMDCDQIYSGLMLCTVEGLIRPIPDERLPLHYAAPVAGQMELGTALVATNLNKTDEHPNVKIVLNGAQDRPAPSKHFKHHHAHKHGH